MSDQRSANVFDRTGLVGPADLERAGPPRVKILWVASGCNMCGLCQAMVPEVFELGDGSCAIRAGFVPSRPDLARAILEAAAACPVDVIRFEAPGSGPSPDGGRVHAS